MTLREWNESDQARVYSTRWFADTKGGFGGKGMTAYGDCSNCEIMKFEYDANGHPTLWLWDFIWGICPEPNTSTKDRMLRHLQALLSAYMGEVQKFGRDDRIVQKKMTELIGCKEMVEALIGLPVNLGLDGKVTVGF